MKKAMKKNNGKIAITLSLLTICINILITSPLQAASWLDRQTGIQPEDPIAQEFGGEPKDVRVITAQVVNIFLGFLGIIFVIYLIMAGFKWMNSKGEAAETKKAKDMITNAIIGLVIIAAAWGITSFVLSRAVNPDLKATPLKTDLNANNGGTFGIH